MKTILLGFIISVTIFAQGNWIPQNSGTTASLFGVSFVTEDVGWVVGGPGIILKTTNGGTSWAPQTSGTTFPLYSVSFTDTNNGTAVGVDRTIIRTTNGGYTWNLQSSGGNHLNSVWFTDENNGTAVGDAEILRTTNGGTTWIQQTSGTTQGLNGVFFIDANNGWAVGTGSTIIRTTNGGTTWTPQTSGITELLRNVAFTDLNNGTIVGDYGTILRTTNGGATWTTQTSAATNRLYAVSFINLNNGTVVGFGGKIFSTTNGGTTWIQQTSGTTNDLYFVDFIDANNGWAVGTGGTILKYSAPSIEVISPNGGENWIIGSQQNIGWASNNISNVKIEYTTNNGTSWINIITSTPSDGSYSWTVPNSQSNQCKVRISDVINSTINDESDNIFTISGIPALTITTPNGAENWTVGDSQNILWTSANVSNVKLEYTTNNGTSWIEIIASTPSDGAYSWTVPNTPSAQSKVRVSDVTNTNINDMSDNNFTISAPTLTVISPNGGENWLVGSTQNITWSSSNVSNVKIEYSTNSGVSWITVINSTTNSGNYSWTIPSTASNNCRVKISNTANLSIYDESDNDFIISQPSITVSSPNGGEGWQIGTVQNITWSSSNVNNVKLEYTTNNGSSWITIIGSTPSDGSYNWTVPNTPSYQSKVKVSDVSNPSVSDESNNTFSIIQFLFFAKIQADSIWIDTDYDGLELGAVDGSGSYISLGTITNYEWYVNNEFVTNGANPTIQLITGTSVVKLIAYNNTGLSASDSIDISVYSAKLSTSGAILSGISQYGNNFYVTSMNNGVYRIDSTGSIKQSYITGGSIQSSLCISNQTGLMYVGSTDTRLYCFDTSLNSMWDKGLGGVVNNSATVNYNGEVVYVGANDNNTHLGFLKSLVASNGNPKWTFQADGTILSSPVVMEVVDSNSIVIRTIIYFGTNKGTIYALDDMGSTYNLFWSETTNPDSAIVSSPAISSDGMIYFGSKNGYLYRFTWDGIYQTGWKKYTGGAIISSPIIDENGIVYIASSSGYVYGFNKDFTFSSDPLKRFYQNVGINGTAGIGPDGTLLVGCDNGKFFALDKNISGTDMPVKWHFQSTGPVLAPTLVTNNGIAYVGSTNGDVFIMRDPGIGGKKTSMASYEWPTFKGNNQRSKVVRLVSNATTVQDENTIIADYNLFQNFPNPFNPNTKIFYTVPKSSLVQLKVFDLLGQEIATLVNEEKFTGKYEVNFDASNLPSGVYLYNLRAGEFVQTRKMILMK